MGCGRAKQYTAAGTLGAGLKIVALVFSPTSSVSSAVIKEGGTGGTTVLTLTGAADGASVCVGPFAIMDPYLSSITSGAKLTVIA